MATTIEEVVSFLAEEGLRFSHSEGNDYLRTGFATQKYVDADGAKLLHLIVAVEEQGKFIKIAAPAAYHFHHDGTSFHKLALFQTLLQICHMTKMVQFEYDAEDGEVRAIIEFPLEDALLTSRQLMRCIHGLVKVMDRNHFTIVDAIKHGLTPESPAALQKAYEKYLEERRAKRKRDMWGDGKEA